MRDLSIPATPEYVQTRLGPTSGSIEPTDILFAALLVTLTAQAQCDLDVVQLHKRTEEAHGVMVPIIVHQEVRFDVFYKYDPTADQVELYDPIDDKILRMDREKFKVRWPCTTPEEGPYGTSIVFSRHESRVR